MTYDELLDKVYEAYYECRSKKRNKESSLEFELDYEKNLRILTNDLWSGTYDIGKAIAFVVTRPKLREVFAADFRDRIVHHLIIREFGLILDDEMIDDSFSCRVGKGVYYGVRRFREQIIEISNNYTEEAYVLSCDISGFFMSIDKGLCYEMLEETLKLRCGERDDLDWWLALIKKVVMNRPELNCEIRGDKRLFDMLANNKTLFRSNGKGFPIGNLTSQVFGNFYLTKFDKWSIAYFGDKGRYCRYVDDIRITCKDKKLLMRYLYDARIWLQINLRITLHPRKWSLQSVYKGIPFIGSVVKPWGIYAGNRLVNNAFGILVGDSTLSKYVMRLNSYFGFLIHDLTYGIRWRLWKSIPEYIKEKVVNYDMKKILIRASYKS